MKKSIYLAVMSAIVPFSSFAVEPSPIKSQSRPDVVGTIKNWSPSGEVKINLPVTKFTLENGLTVLLLEDRSVPMISYHTWYKVGSKDEGKGTTGAAHMLEHMMFKGASKYDGKAFDHQLHSNGISNNAFTTYDYTGFYEDLPSSKLELVMDMEVDRMSSLALKAEDLKSEKEVVAEERRWRVDNNPNGLLREKIFGTVFKTSPYSWPIIGHMEDIQNYDVEKLRYFYKTFYVPNNAVLVVVGDFETAKTRRMIEKYYGKLKKSPVPERNYPKEDVQKAAQTAVLKQDVQSTSVALAFRAPASGHEDTFALDIAADVLGNGTSSRLHRELVYKAQVASGSYAYNMSLQNEGLFMVGVMLKPGQNSSTALNIVNGEVNKIRQSKVSLKDLDKAKNQVMKGIVDSLTTMQGKARLLASYEILTGSYENLFVDIEKYNKVTAEDVQRVANKYFQTSQKTVIELQPKK